MDELVSIIMPSYNTASYIEASVQSVLAQSYPHWELLIVDDCSTDATPELLRRFNDPRIRVFRNDKNSGAAVSRNYALREARGRWIAFLDSDDTWAPEKLEKQLAFMRMGGYAFSFTDYRICLNGQWMPYINTGPDFVDRRKLYRYCYFSTITVMYDAKRVGLLQGADIRVNNDYALWLKAIEKAPAHRLPECLSFYIKHDSSVSGGSKLKLIKWHYRLFRRAMGESCALALWHTLGNLYFGVLKKLVYKEPIIKEA